MIVRLLIVGNRRLIEIQKKKSVQQPFAEAGFQLPVARILWFATIQNLGGLLITSKLIGEDALIEFIKLALLLLRLAIIQNFYVRQFFAGDNTAYFQQAFHAVCVFVLQAACPERYSAITARASLVFAFANCSDKMRLLQLLLQKRFCKCICKTFFTQL